MIKILLTQSCLIFTFLVLASFHPPKTFKEAQMQYPRVKEAYDQKLSLIKQYFTRHNLQLERSSIFIRVFKEEGELEVWGRKTNGTYQLIHTYAICAASGKLGPKWKQGDGQVPEGFYFIDRFNPSSLFHLSLGVNYPNAADLKRCGKVDPGGDIFIHGSCVTIGCVPLTDDKIKELYIMAVETKNAGTAKVPVHIFPGRMNEANWKILQQKYQDNEKLIHFWQNLKEGYDLFEKNKLLPSVQIAADGTYHCS